MTKEDKKRQKEELKNLKAIEKANKEKLLKLYPFLNEESGIYILTREENLLEKRRQAHGTFYLWRVLKIW